MTLTRWLEITCDEFLAFLDAYPNPLTGGADTVGESGYYYFDETIRAYFPVSAVARTAHDVGEDGLPMVRYYRRNPEFVEPLALSYDDPQIQRQIAEHQRMALGMWSGRPGISEDTGKALDRAVARSLRRPKP